MFIIIVDRKVYFLHLTANAALALPTHYILYSRGLSKNVCNG